MQETPWGWSQIVIPHSRCCENPASAEDVAGFSRHLSLRWRHNGRDSVSNHQPRDCLLNRLFRRRSKKTSKLCVTGLCAGNSPGTGEFPAQRASDTEDVSIWWRHHVSEIYRSESSLSGSFFIIVTEISLDVFYCWNILLLNVIQWTIFSRLFHLSRFTKTACNWVRHGISHSVNFRIAVSFPRIEFTASPCSKQRHDASLFEGQRTQQAHVI